MYLISSYHSSATKIIEFGERGNKEYSLWHTNISVYA